MSVHPDEDVTFRDEGEFISGPSLIERLRAYSVGRDVGDAEEPDDGRRVRVAEVKVGGVWIPL